MPADGTNVVAFEIEARLLRWGDSSHAGKTVTFELDPEGDPHPFKEYLAGAKNGQRFRILYAPIGDDEQSTLPTAADVRGILKDEAQAPARSNPNRSEQAKDAYRNAAPMKQAATRAAMLCEDGRFQDWIAPRTDAASRNGSQREMDAKFALYGALDISSRGDIGRDESAYRRFLELETDFRIAVGELPSPR